MTDFLNSDPLEWGVEEVVAFLCNPASAPWALSATSPRPDLLALAAALRDNEIAGEALLYDVDPQAIKDDLGVKALGHRSSVNRAIEWLRARSTKYQLSKASAALPKTHFPESPPKNISRHGTSIPGVSSLETIATQAVVHPSPIASPVPVQYVNGKRKMAPTFISRDSEQHGLRHDVHNSARGGSSGRSQMGQPPQLLPNHLERPQNDANSEAFFDKLMAKYAPVENEEVLPVYGDSGSEASFDSETWDEISPKHKLDSQNPDGAKLSPEDVASVVSQYIADQEELWKEKVLPKKLSIARYIWQEAQSNAAAKSDCSDRLRHLECRLSTQKTELQKVAYHSRARVEKSCAAMDMTISEICFQRWRLNVLDSAVCPPDVEPPPTASQPWKEQSAHKDSDDDRSEDLGYDTGDSFESEDLGDFIISDSEEEISERQQKHVRDPDRSKSHSPARKRPRMIENKVTEDSDANAGFSLVSCQPTDGFDFVDLTGMSPASTTFSQKSDKAITPTDPEGTEDLDIQTPPLNPTPSIPLHDAEMDLDLSMNSPPIDPILETRIESPKPATPLDNINGISLAQTGEKRSSVSPHVSTGDKTLPARQEDIDMIKEVSNKSAEELANSQDRIRLLAKNIMHLSPDELQSFPKRLNALLEETYTDLVEETLRAMILNQLNPRSKERDTGENAFAVRIAELFLSWHHCIVLAPDRGIEKKFITEGLAAIQQDSHGMFPAFLRRFKGFISAIKSYNIPNPPRENIASHNRGDANCGTHLGSKNAGQTGNKKKSATRLLSTQQNEAQKRLHRQEKARAALERETERRGLSLHDPAGQAVTFKEPKIFLHPELGKFVKPHQLRGIQFMWRELIDATDSQGCLLAHVMGLGKTFQVICLLVTIAAAAASDDIKIRNQIPRKFHRSQTLVLCPSGVIENWIDEFAIWAPSGHKLGAIRDIIPRAQQDEVFDRLERIKAWNSDGGVLIMSYEMLRSLIQYRPTKASRPLSIEQQEFLSECLLSGPNIVVADEAHKLKGEKSAISQIASRFKTNNRIAMTGSPLANHLSEYYQMVEWISPGYLESPQSFKTKFMEPIQAGSYIDSTKAEQRESLCALKVLGGILNPKIHRADTSAIASELPSKTEFVIVVPLTDLQRRVYDTFVACLKKSSESDAATKLWSWLALLQLCCNHPVPFREKLADRSNQSATDPEEALEGENSVSVLPVSIKDAGLPSDLFPKIEALFNSVQKPLGPEFSHRSILLNQILDEAANVGDKVLVFSQSIPTMDYLDKLLKKSGRKFLRLDGKTLSAQRQSLCKRFNTSNTEQIFLISTRAGGLGLNITGANRVVIFDFLFNPTWEEQAIGRAYRLGQKKPVFVYRFIAGGTFEDNIFNKAVYKSQLAVRVVDKMNTIREAAKKTDEYLKTVRQVERESHDEILGQDPQVLDKILAGPFGKVALKVSLSHLKNNESDTLDGEELKRVNEELRMEQLKRSNRPAYEAELQRRQAMLAAEQRKKDEELRGQFLMMTQAWKNRENATPVSLNPEAIFAASAVQEVSYIPTAMSLRQPGKCVASMSSLGYSPSSASMSQRRSIAPLTSGQGQSSPHDSVLPNPSLPGEHRVGVASVNTVTSPDSMASPRPVPRPYTKPFKPSLWTQAPQQLNGTNGHLSSRFPVHGLSVSGNPKPYAHANPPPAVTAPHEALSAPNQSNPSSAVVAISSPSPYTLGEPMNISSDDDDAYSPQLNDCESNPHSPNLEVRESDAYSPPANFPLLP
ncbi:uncharacterized protein N7477_007540 [Penicillium maclennaniae]|uniref:uncharacterized protein n=1 Tax=Penicillium maclennaniae TaxID=1343394 RepID=UPI0025406AA6|nr:uncharacterized protein N7477_007540 [Penicillium maclennaniae]KAJ5665092.1 hypothetical protein N7477_007540 [Penicillium maclennaniae]